MIITIFQTQMLFGFIAAAIFLLYSTVTTLWANSADDTLMILFLFSQEIGFDISCKCSPMETICMK